MASTVVLDFDHMAGAWPWNYNARQTFGLTAPCIADRSQLDQSEWAADAGEPGISFLIRRYAVCCKCGEVAGVWLNDENCIPETQVSCRDLGFRQLFVPPREAFFADSR
jgi:hypothetical protein